MEPGEFEGTIGRYHWESEPWWPEDPRPPEGAPNVLLVILDDVGFAQLGCFGSDIATPHLDALAAAGLRYSSFHTTALCSPTRACVLTGRNHHAAGMGRIVDLATGFPGYDARIPQSVALLPAMLTPHGYAAYAVGKWHLTPEDEEHLGARRDRWPLGRGFERYYGFFPGETHQFVPALIHDNHQVEPPAGYDDGYHLTTDLVDRSIEFIEDLRNVDVDKPWLLYLATGACHSPHQSPAEWIERYHGHFDAGWDAWREATLARQKTAGVVPPHTELSERPDWVPAWDTSVRERDRYTYWPGRAPVAESVAVNVRGRPHSITAHVTIPDDATVVEGVLAVQGSVLGGWSFHLLADGRLVYVHNLAGWRTYRVEALVSPDGRLAPGDHTLTMRFDPPLVELLVDGVVVGTGEVRRTVWSRFSLTGAGLSAGWSPDFSPADEDYRGRFAFTATLHRVDIDVTGRAIVDPEIAAEEAIATQ